ncbi:hypothetical protein MC885_009130 [Smutsia gigantea]|nr:hypothetical protein MC885_009130 [Smutsia gigantea]
MPLKGRRVGPIKLEGPITTTPYDDKVFYNCGPKRRSGPIKPEKVLDLAIPMDGNLEMNALHFIGKTTSFTEQKLKVSILHLLNSLIMKKQFIDYGNYEEVLLSNIRSVQTEAWEDEGTYDQTLEFRRGGDGQPRRSTRPTRQFYQPPHARN